MMATTSDIVFITGYLAVTLFFGLWMTKRASKDLDAYYLGGRTIPWWILGTSGMAAWFDLTGTMLITSFLYMLGPQGLFVEFRGGAVLILAFMLCYTAKWHRRSGCMTPAEWMVFRFGRGPSQEFLRFMIALTSILAAVGMLAYLVRGCSIFVGMFFPEYMMEITVGLLLITTFYTALAGFFGVAITDFIQALIIVAACVVLSVMAFILVGGTPDFADVAERVTNNPGWSDSAPVFEAHMPPGYEPYRLLLLFAAVYLLRNVLGGMGTGAEQRYFAAKTDREAGLQTLLQGVMVAFRWPLMIAFAVMGIFYVDRLVPDQQELTRAQQVIMEANPDLEPAQWHVFNARVMTLDDPQYEQLRADLREILGEDYQRKLALLSRQGTIDPERILPAVLIHEIPGLLRSLLLVAMIAALMSTLTTELNRAAAMFVRDMYQRHLRKRAPNRELILMSYGTTFIVMALGFLMGMAAEDINDIWGWVVMGLGGGSLGPLFLRLYWWRCTAWGMAAGLLLGGVGSVVQRLVHPGMHEFAQLGTMATLSFGGVIIVSLLTKPSTPAVLDNFFRRTRPFGFWGPIRKKMSAEEQDAWRKENTYDVLAVPFTLLAQVTAFLMPMQLIIHRFDAFAFTLVLFLIGAAGMYFFWWKKLPATNSFEMEPVAPAARADQVGIVEPPPDQEK